MAGKQKPVSEEVGKPGERLSALFLLGVVLFNPLLLDVFDAGPDVVLLGIPILYLYVFVAWAILIALMTVVVEWATRHPEQPPPPSEVPTSAPPVSDRDREGD